MTPDTPTMDEKETALIEKYAAACKRNAYEMKTMPMTAIRQHFKEFADELRALAALSVPTPGTGGTEDTSGKAWWIEEREDDALLVAPHWNYGKACVARRPKLMTNEEWRPIAQQIIAGIASLSTPPAGDLGAVKVKGIRDCLEAIEYASGNCIKEHGQKTVNELAKVALSYLGEALSSPPVGEMDGWQRATEHEVLFIASYCGDDNTACSEARPCPTCLGMANVYTIPDGTLIKYQRQLSPDWLGNKHLEKLGARQIGKAPRVRKSRSGHTTSGGGR